MRGCTRIIGLGALAVGLALAPGAGGATIKVKPRPNAIQKAVDKADSGDKLMVKGGTYKEDVIVDKRLKIIGESDDRPLIDGDCNTLRTIDVVNRGVTLKHLAVKGAVGGEFAYTVNIIGPESGTLDDLVLKESCNSNPAAYGVNANNTGALEITGLKISGGFLDAGIYVGSIGNTGGKNFRVTENVTPGNNVGILIEDSIPAAQILVKDNVTNGNDFDGYSDPAGILVRGSDGGRYVDNRSNNNGDYGIHLNSDSEDNILTGNIANGNDTNFFDEGSGNCGTGNSFLIAPCGM